MNAICLVIDRLHFGYVGAYGNSWIETPALDRLAVEGFVFDQAWIDSPNLTSLYRSYWTGRHSLEPEPQDAPPTLARLVAAQGVQPVLMTDEPTLLGHPALMDFDDLVELDERENAGTAAEVEETYLAECFARLIDWLDSASSPFLLWCHLQGLAAPWDAPQNFRRAYADEEDPVPPETTDVPNRLLNPAFDPDELLGINQAYAGQVTLLDICVGALAEFLQTSPIGKDTLLVLLSARGFPLGEHLRVGPWDEALHAELTHVPFLLRFPDGLGAAGRSHALVQPTDLWATLLDWWAIADHPMSATSRSLLPIVRGDAEMLRDRLTIRGDDGERAIVTPGWYLREAEKPELFVQPDDRWQVNDAAHLCPEIAESLQNALAQFEQAAHSGDISSLPPLPEELLSGPE